MTSVKKNADSSDKVLNCKLFNKGMCRHDNVSEHWLAMSRHCGIQPWVPSPLVNTVDHWGIVGVSLNIGALGTSLMGLLVHKPWYVVTNYLIGLFVFGGFESLATAKTSSLKPAFEGNRHVILNFVYVLCCWRSLFLT